MSTIYPNQVNLTDIIAPAFYDVHWDIVDGLHTYYDMYGGRGSTKSSFISVEIVLGMMEDKDANVAVFRKVASTLRESVYKQIQWAIDALGVSDLWEAKVSLLQYVYDEFAGIEEIRTVQQSVLRESRISVRITAFIYKNKEVYKMDKVKLTVIAVALMGW